MTFPKTTLPMLHINAHQRGDLECKGRHEGLFFLPFKFRGGLWSIQVVLSSMRDFCGGLQWRSARLQQMQTGFNWNQEEYTTGCVKHTRMYEVCPTIEHILGVDEIELEDLAEWAAWNIGQNLAVYAMTDYRNGLVTTDYVSNCDGDENSIESSVMEGNQDVIPLTYHVWQAMRSCTTFSSLGISGYRGVSQGCYYRTYQTSVDSKCHMFHNANSSNTVAFMTTAFNLRGPDEDNGDWCEYCEEYHCECGSDVFEERKVSTSSTDICIIDREEWLDYYPSAHAMAKGMNDWSNG